MFAFLHWPRITKKQVEQRKRAEDALHRIEKIEKESKDTATRHRIIQQNNHFIESIFGDPT